MAIQDRNENNQNIAQAVQQQAQQQTPQYQSQAVPNSQPFFQKNQTNPNGMSWSSPFITSAVAPNIGDEFYKKFKDSLIEVFKTAVDQYEFTVIDLDRTNFPQLAFSGLLVAARSKANRDLVVYHSLILESTGDRIPDVYENFNNDRYAISRFTSDAFDNEFCNLAAIRIKDVFKLKPDSCIGVDAMVIPRNFNVEDKSAIHAVARESATALTTELTVRSVEFRDINLSAMKNDSTLNMAINYNKTVLTDSVGMPIRSDFGITISTVVKQQGQTNKLTVNSGAREIPITNINGFIETAYSPAAPQTVNGQTFYPTQKFINRAVITNINSPYSYTPAMMLLAVADVNELRRNKLFFQCYRPMPGKTNTVDLTDVGVLNIECNLGLDPSGIGKPLNTKEASFTTANLIEFLDRTIQPGLAISIDCPDAGPQSWFLSMYPYACNGNRQAYDIIYDAANQLTNGIFGKYFPRGTAIFTNSAERIHLGFWTDQTGQKRDLRDFDYIAIANLAEKNPALIREYIETCFNFNIPILYRLARRKAIIENLVPNAEFTGFASRVTFTAKFINDLVTSIAETGLMINQTSGASSFIEQRGAAGFASGLLGWEAGGFAHAAGMQVGPQWINSVHQGQHRFW